MQMAEYLRLRHGTCLPHRYQRMCVPLRIPTIRTSNSFADDQNLYEDETVNRMQEAMTLFESVANSRSAHSASDRVLADPSQVVHQDIDHPLPQQNRSVPSQTSVFTTKPHVPRVYRRVKLQHCLLILAGKVRRAESESVKVDLCGR